MSQRSGKKRENLAVMDTNGWLTTFADLVMLLLTFFVMLLSMSSMDAKKLKETFSRFQGAPGVLELGSNQEINSLSEFVSTYETTDHLLVVDHTLMEKMLVPTQETRPDQVKEVLEKIDTLFDITADPLGIAISFHGELFFSPGKAELREVMIPFLNTVAEAIEDCDNDIFIVGHTDDIPARGSVFGSNRQLSLKRAEAVLDYFVNQHQIPSQRFAVGGYGADRPLVPNDTPENRNKNRRVQIIFKIL
ncbi:MAG: flagellar motor protein MotB [Desulfotignum sp.]|nr:flagellar motor protein MotB [Desulfotignum sp.]MCF8136097.1 flagellar motor protein MotB [Desulfotignum sp.]